MAVYIHCNFNSEVLRMATDVNILIPDNDRVRQFREKTNVPVKYQTLYLLHGLAVTIHTIFEKPILKGMRTSIRLWWLCRVCTIVPIRI